MSRTRWAMAALATAALISAGCSNAPSAATGASSSTASPIESGTGGNASSGASQSASPHAQAVQFAQCMRDNGVSDFPDPAASGAFTIDGLANGSSLDTNSAAFEQAISACKDLEPAGFTGAVRTPEQQAAALKFAQCVRDNGVKDFPDPAPDAPLVDTNLIPSSGRSGGMSILNAAMRSCRALAEAAGVNP